jgi:hypothetical protein
LAAFAMSDAGFEVDELPFGCEDMGDICKYIFYIGDLIRLHKIFVPPYSVEPPVSSESLYFSRW